MAVSSENLENVFIREIEKNARFMDFVRQFPEDAYERRNDAEFLKTYPHYVKYTGYKAMIRFHAPKLLHLQAPKKNAHALDIGGGAGYLAWMLACLGYEPLVIDVPEKDEIKPLQMMRDALGLKTVYHWMKAFEPLPELKEAPFSLVTATNLVFDDGWRLVEYAYFLRDVARRMESDGQIYLYFNPPQAEVIWGCDEILGFFLRMGAREIVEKRALLFQGVGRLQRL